MMIFKPIAVALFVLVPSLSAAQEIIPDVRVSYVDLDLGSPAGVRTLDRRLARAVKLACPDASGTVIMARKMAAHRCLSTKAAEVAMQRQRVLAAVSPKSEMASSFR